MSGSLAADLAELERTDPVVAKAAANYDRVVARILAAPLDDDAFGRARLLAIGCLDAGMRPWACACGTCRIARREVARRAVERLELEAGGGA